MENSLSPADNHAKLPILPSKKTRKAEFRDLKELCSGLELRNHHGLLEWFLAQEGSVNGFTRTIYSGLPTDELARIVAEFVLPKPDLTGLFQVASEPISKYELLCLVAKTYGKAIDIHKDELEVENKSLSYDKFHRVTGYVARPWAELVADMRRSRLNFLTGDTHFA